MGTEPKIKEMFQASYLDVFAAAQHGQQARAQTYTHMDTYIQKQHNTG